MKTGESGILPNNIFKKDGYSIVGWSLYQNGEISYIDGGTYKSGSESTVTLYAVWDAIEYTVTYHSTELMVNEFTFTVADLPLDLITLNNKPDYMFECWYANEQLQGGRLIQLNTIGNIDLYPSYVEATNGLIFNEREGELAVSEYTGSSLTVVIPDYFLGKPVTAIDDNAFKGRNSITSIKLPSTLKIIGDGAFYSCHSIRSITIPDGVTPIGDTAFAYCRTLQKLKIPEGVRSIGERAFYGCEILDGTILPSNIKKVGDKAFYNCRALKSIKISESVTTMGANVFENCDSLYIYCEAVSMPLTWETAWNSSNCPVVWGVK